MVNRECPFIIRPLQVLVQSPRAAERERGEGKVLTGFILEQTISTGKCNSVNVLYTLVVYACQ